MKRTTALALALVVAACADNRSSVEIDGRAAPSDTTQCTFAAGGKNVLGPGLLDVAQSPIWNPRYSLVVYVKNDLVDPATLNSGALTSSKAWTANAARIRMNPAGYVGQFNPSPKLAGASPEDVLPLDGQTILPGGSSTQYVDAVGVGSAIVQELQGIVTDPTPQRIVLGITLEGRTSDGATLDTGEWYFPLDVCAGCLAAPTCAAGEVLKQTNCFGAGQDSAPVCVAAQ